MKKNKVISLFLIIILILSLTNSVFAVLAPGQILISQNVKGAEDLKRIGNDIIGIIKVVGIVSSVIILSVIGFKIMTGSIEEKAKYKSKLMPYVIGAIILFAAPTIADIVYDYGTNRGKTEIPQGGTGEGVPGAPAKPVIPSPEFKEDNR